MAYHGLGTIMEKDKYTLRHKTWKNIRLLSIYLTKASVTVLSTDRFFTPARVLGLPQSFCCHTPKTLLEAWEKGALPRGKVQG